MKERKWRPDGRVSPEGKKYGHVVIVQTLKKNDKEPEEPPAFFPEGSSTERPIRRGAIGNYNADIVSAAEDDKTDTKKH